MARKRFISPEFFFHKKLWDAEKATGLPLRLAFIGLWTQADRRSVFQWDADRLGAQIVPFDRSVDFGAVLDALEAAGFVMSFDDESGRYGYIPTFQKWQTFHPNEKASHHPDFHVVTQSRPKDGLSRSKVSSTGTRTGVPYGSPVRVPVPTPAVTTTTTTAITNGGGGLQCPPSPPLQATDTEACAADSGKANPPTAASVVANLGASLDWRSMFRYMA